MRFAGCGLFQCVREIRAALVFLKIRQRARLAVHLESLANHVEREMLSRNDKAGVT